MSLRHSVGGIKADTHASLRSIAMHKRLKEFLFTSLVYAWAGILDNELQFPVVSLQTDTDSSMLWRILNGIAKQIIGNRIQDMTVEHCIISLIEWSIGQCELFLLGGIPEILVYVTHKTNDIAFLNT